MGDRAVERARPVRVHRAADNGRRRRLPRRAGSVFPAAEVGRHGRSREGETADVDARGAGAGVAIAATRVRDMRTEWRIIMESGNVGGREGRRDGRCSESEIHTECCVNGIVAIHVSASTRSAQTE